MKYLFLFFLPLLFIIISCTDNEPTEPTTFTDAELKAKIIGTWSNAYISINYEANGNFSENVDIDYTLEDSTYNQSEIIKGTYEIENGILRQYLTEWKIINFTPFGSGFVPPASKIIFSKDFLYSYPLNILTRIGEDSDSLWGEWYTYDWTHHYSDPDVFGKLEQTFNFNKDSMTVTWGLKVSYDSSQGYYYQTDSLTYNPPDISWDIGIPRTIEFQNGQMWLYYKLSQPLTPLKKVK